MVSNANGQAACELFNAWMTKVGERMDDALADKMLSRIEEQQLFEFRAAFARDARGKNDVHARFLDCTRFHKSAAELTGPKSAARKFTP